MPKFYQTPTNPMQLATLNAEQLAIKDDFLLSPNDELNLSGLTQIASELGFLGTHYTVKSHRCVGVMNNPEVEYNKPFVEHGNLAFGGIFKAYAWLSVRRDRGLGSTRALCMLFEDVKIFPLLDDAPNEYDFLTPVLAVSRISTNNY